MNIEYTLPEKFYKLREPIAMIIRKTLLTVGTRPAIIGCYIGGDNNINEINHLGVISGSTVTPMDIAIKLSSYHLYIKPDAIKYDNLIITDVDGTTMRLLNTSGQTQNIVDYLKRFDNITKLTLGDLNSSSEVFEMKDGEKDLSNEVIAEFPNPVSFTLHLAIAIIDGDYSSKETCDLLDNLSYFALPAVLFKNPIHFEIPEDDICSLKIQFDVPEYFVSEIENTLCNELSNIFQTPSVEK